MFTHNQLVKLLTDNNITGLAMIAFIGPDGMTRTTIATNGIANEHAVGMMEIGQSAFIKSIISPQK